MYYYRGEMRKNMTEDERIQEDSSLFQPIKLALYIGLTSNFYFQTVDSISGTFTDKRILYSYWATWIVVVALTLVAKFMKMP